MHINVGITASHVLLEHVNGGLVPTCLDNVLAPGPPHLNLFGRNMCFTNLFWLCVAGLKEKEGVHVAKYVEWSFEKQVRAPVSFLALFMQIFIL